MDSQTKMDKSNVANYELATIRLLGGFQLVEEALKIYITLAYELIQDCLKEKIPFNYSASDVENFPLERLLNTFGKLSRSDELLVRLNKLRDVRNHVAHQSLVAVIGSNERVVGDKISNFLELNHEVLECLRLLIVEIRALSNKR
jgi:hypothetical protein